MDHPAYSPLGFAPGIKTTNYHFLRRFQQPRFRAAHTTLIKVRDDAESFAQVIARRERVAHHLSALHVGFLSRLVAHIPIDEPNLERGVAEQPGEREREKARGP